MNKKSENSCFSCWALLFPCSRTDKYTDLDSYPEQGLELLPICDISNIRGLESDELYFSSQSIIKGDNDLRVIGPIRSTELPETLGRDLFESSCPTFFMLHVSGHWISCLLLPSQRSTSATQCFLIESYDRNKGETRQEDYKQIIDTIESAYNNASQIAPTFNSTLLYTGHQDEAESCGLCVLLYLQRIAAAIAEGRSIQSPKEMMRILVLPTDGNSLGKRELFICHTVPKMFNIEVASRGNLVL